MRLDLYLTKYKNVKTRSKSQLLIEKGLVLIDGEVAKKPSKEVHTDCNITIKEANIFASRGGEKLARAIKAFDFSVTNKVFLDVGASNGGFTHCLLQNGAKKVYAIDIGENQLEDFLVQDKRVEVMDKTNARNLNKDMFIEDNLFVVSDLSFISLTLVIPVLAKISQNMLLLIKPQFECGKKALNKNGIVTDNDYFFQAITKVQRCANENGLNMTNLTVGSLKQNKNTEFVCHLSKGEDISIDFIQNLTKNLNIFYLPLE